MSLAVTPKGLVDRSPQPPAGSRRADVLSRLREAEGPLSVAEVGELTGLHTNTARFHLDALVDEGLASRTAEPRAVPGRPRILYSAEGPAAGPRSYALLAEMLTGVVASMTDAGPAAVDAGRAWGRHLVERPTPSERVDAEEAVRRLNAVLDAVGFEPAIEPGTNTGETEIRLRHCPFREVAERHTDVVCSIHLGLMRGALEELGAPVAATSLDPWVTPSVCVAHLQNTSS